MSLEEKRRLILTLDSIIRGKVPGRAEELASKLGVSRSTFFRLIEYMREELFAPIVFDVTRNRYIYEEEGVVFFRFVPIQALDMKHARKILEGYSKKNL
jgi:predicted DNA-binding transcriptional regulator YafY